MNQLGRTNTVLWALGLSVIFWVSGCFGGISNDGLPYKVTASNIGQNGVMVLDPSLLDLNYEPTNQWRGVTPSFPGTQATRIFRAFAGYPDALPEAITIKWQLAELSDCESVERVKSYPDHVRKRGCTWTPIEGKVFRKELDMQAIQASKAYQRVGEIPEDASYLSGRYTLVIELIFNEDKLRVDTRNGQSLGFMQ